jgi:2-C-methyl-D-erythritol 4-phosphate cytidylyltransferase
MPRMPYHALVPAAGGGARMNADVPKQYLPLAERPLIWHALATLCSVPLIERVFVVLAPGDEYWNLYDWSPLGDRLEVLRCGGAQRADSVGNGLRAIAKRVAADDWVLVHDAARACLEVSQVETLIREVGNDSVGGILAVPLADTLKRAGPEATGETRIAATVPREHLWLAQTPQMFRHGMLLAALERTPAVTDEASAMEACGHRPRLIAADATNFKITYPQDMWLAETLLRQRNPTL